MIEREQFDKIWMLELNSPPSKHIAELLLRVGAQAPCMHVENTLKYDGQPASTKDQGED